MSMRSLLCGLLRGAAPVRDRDVLALDARSLAADLRVTLAGVADDPVEPGAIAPTRVVWMDEGDEVLVDLGSVSVKFLDAAVEIAVDLACEETGANRLSVAFALGDAPQPAVIRGEVVREARGDATLVARWGAILESAAWAALLGAIESRAAAAGARATGASVRQGRLLVSLQRAPLSKARSAA